jgi:hypothetical protein
MEPQQKIVENLEKQLDEANEKTNLLRIKISQEKEILKSVCEKETGHHFKAESDDDCHNPGWYYTCQYCGFWTNHRPRK